LLDSGEVLEVDEESAEGKVKGTGKGRKRKPLPATYEPGMHVEPNNQNEEPIPPGLQTNARQLG
jgi:hypothetical protein